MPEGDSVARLSRRLQPLVGRTIEHSDFRVPRLATVDLTGTVITRVWPHGKHLFWACGDLVLHTHLRMEGNWRIHPVGTRWSAPAHTARVVLRVSGDIELVGHDLGLVEVWPATQYGARTGHLGPDPLADDWTTPGRWLPDGRSEALRRVLAVPGRTIGEALLAAHDRGHRQRVPGRGLFPERRPPGRRRRRCRRGCDRRPLGPPPAGQPRHPRPDLHRRSSARAHHLRVRPQRAAMPALRSVHRGRHARRRHEHRRPPAGTGTPDLVVSTLPAEALTQALSGRSA